MSKTRHWVYSDFDAAWQGGLGQWLKEYSVNAWTAEKPVLVLCPNSAMIALVKQRLLEAHIPALGIHFITPGGLRRLLLPLLKNPPRVALREDLHLLARVAADRFPDEPIAQSIALEPSALVQAIDALESAGWGPEVLPSGTVRQIAEQVLVLLDTSGLGSTRSIDLKLSTVVSQSDPHIHACLALGFSSADWPQFFLLQALASSSSEAIFCFQAEGLRPASEVWSGTWEDLIGPVEVYFSAEEETPFSQVADDFSLRQNGEAAVSLVPLQTQSCEVDTVLALSKQALHGKLGGRIGIIVPHERTALGREIALRLAEDELPHQDRPGHRPAHEQAHSLFGFWVELQREQSLGSLLQFARAWSQGGHFTAQKFEQLHRVSEDLFRDLMTSDLAVLSAYEKQSNREPYSLSQILQEWPLFIEKATFEYFLSSALPQLERLGWPVDLEALRERADQLVVGLKSENISCLAFLKWLESLADIPGRTRNEHGREPFAHLQLTTLSEASGLPWDSLVLVGMTHEEWAPELRESPYLPDSVIRSLNARVCLKGDQGEGHLVVKSGYGWLLTKSDESLLSEDRLAGLIGTTRNSVGVTLSLEDPSNPSVYRQASEWFLRLFRATQGTGLTSGKLHQLALLQEQALAKPKSESVSLFPAIKEAWTQRRDLQSPFNEYSYCLGQALESSFVLPASAWGRLFFQPVSVWYASVLKTDQPFEPEKESSAQMTRGIWTHDWLNPSEDKQESMHLAPSYDAWLARVVQKADEQFALALKSFKAAGRELPQWWEAHWAWAKAMATSFAGKLSQSLEGQYVIGETKLPLGGYSITSDFQMELKGRLDLLVADNPVSLLADDTEVPDLLAVVDYKTGSDKPLTDKRLSKGEGLQIALYAMAASNRFRSNASAVLLTPDAAFKMDLHTEHLRELESLWKSVRVVYESGTLGDKPGTQNRFAFSAPRPLAEIIIADAILDQKWSATHPTLVD